MNETRCRVMRRFASAMFTPAVSATLSALSKANRTNATSTDKSVSDVRSFFRFRLLQTSEKNFMRASILRRRGEELAFVQVKRSLRARGRVRIVRHHHDRFAVLLIERLQE